MCLPWTLYVMMLSLTSWSLLDHDVCCKRLFSVGRVVQEVDVLEMTDVEVGSNFTSPFWECGCCTIEDGRCW